MPFNYFFGIGILFLDFLFLILPQRDSNHFWKILISNLISFIYPNLSINKLIIMTELQSRPSNKSPDKTKLIQYKQEIIKLTEGLPPGQFIAYCLVSQVSSSNQFVHQGLLVLNSLKQELSYYSEIPYLPLHNIDSLGKPREKVKYTSANKFQFVLEKTISRHVTVRWNENNQTKNWKLLMGSKEIAEQFSKILTDSKNKAQRYQSSQMNGSRQTNPPKYIESPQKHSQNSKEISFSKTNQILNPVSVSADIKKAERESQEYFNLHYTNYWIGKQNLKQTEPVNYQSYHVLAPLKITDFSEKISEEKSPSLVDQWIKAMSGSQKAAIYEKFLKMCQKKVESLMESFFSTHLQHQQIEGCCLLYEGEINYMYSPLLDQLQYQENAQTLVQRIKIEEKCFYEFESLNHLSGFDRIGNVRVIVPMACIISYKSVKFYCKSTIDYYNQKKFVTEQDGSLILLAELQQKSHIKLRGGEERIFLLKDNSIYLDKISNLPYISGEIPVTTQYIQNNISKGIIGSEKDLQAIKKHIQMDLINEVTAVINQKQVSSSFQMAEILKQYGLNHYYLPFIERKAKKGYFTRIIMSEIVSFAVEWEIRRKMQFELFKKKQFGFACNQVKKSFNALFQGHQHYLQLINNIIEEYFNNRYNLETCPIDTYILGETMMCEVLFRLGLDCDVLVKENRMQGWIWKEENILENIRLSPFPRIRGYRWGCFSSFPQAFIEKQLFEDINYDIKTETSPQSVLDYLKMKKNDNGQLKPTPEYNLLEPKLKIQVDFYLSHFLVPTRDTNPHKSLQAAVYSNQMEHFNVHSLQYLTTLNQIRWLIKGKYYHQAENLVYKCITQAKIWNQYYALIQIYAVFAQYKLKSGDIKDAIQFSELALEAASHHYEQEHTLLMQLLIAQQSFQTANIYFGIQQYSKSLDFYSKAENILKKVITKGSKISLNPQFLLLYSRKCEIYLLFGQYQNCQEECLEGLECSGKIRKEELVMVVDEKQFKLYEVLFRCFDIQKMRKQMIQLSKICSHKYFEDRVLSSEFVDQRILGELIKMMWIGIIKQVEMISPISNPTETSNEQIKFIYLNKIRKQLLALAKYFKMEQRYSKKEGCSYLKERILRKKEQRVENRLKGEIILCMVQVSTKPRNIWQGKLLSQLGLSSQWAMMEILACLTSFEFLIGSIEMSLHMYSFQWEISK